MNNIVRYAELLEEWFNQPPHTVIDRCEKIMGEYPVDIVDYDKQGFMMVVKISEGFYGISWVIVEPSEQDQGIGSCLLEKVHEKYQGVFITKTRDASQFYKKNGYKEVYRDGDHQILVYVNDKNKVIF